MYTNKKDILKQCKFNAKEYKDLKNNADEFRNTYVGNLANELSLQDGKEASYHLHQILQREKVKKHWNNIKRYENRGRGGGVDKVDVETLEGLQTVTDVDTIVDKIIKANREKGCKQTILHSKSNR